MLYFNDNDIECNYHIKGPKKDCYDIYILLKGRSNFYNLMYKNTGSYLKRKHDSLLALL